MEYRIGAGVRSNSSTATMNPSESSLPSPASLHRSRKNHSNDDPRHMNMPSSSSSSSSRPQPKIPSGFSPPMNINKRAPKVDVVLTASAHCVPIAPPSSSTRSGVRHATLGSYDLRDRTSTVGSTQSVSVSGRVKEECDEECNKGSLATGDCVSFALVCFS